jgi:flagellar secretion chaperone FliS
VAAYAAPQSYQQNAVLTAPPGRLVVMLYDGADRFLRRASLAMEKGDVARSNEALQRGEAILDELLVTLNFEEGGEIATSLRDLYLFCRRHLNEARIDKDHEKVDAVVGLLAELREAFAQIDPDPAGATA